MKMRGLEVERGEIWFADLRPITGSEQGGVRPCVVIQNNTGNKYSPTIIVAVCTTQIKPPLPTHVILEKGEGGVRGRCTVLLEQLRSIDGSRFRQKIGKLDDEQMKDIDKALLVSLGLDKYMINEV